ncbi:hypothetical protein RHMOL_Rhmol11G0092700 [Rhododendron molle]|uniref:Uncharacterized protein n=1 Tax=Rhododendron molle TaxID=49168 RepID=A0ACC0LQE6_RHOML|nr:hypothetical protein RHMOL_Rhmol11G0092700 [Rhododendron molle]
MKDEDNALVVAAKETRLADEKALVKWSNPPPDSLRAQFTLGNKRPKEEWKLFLGDAWRVTIDGASNVNRAGAGIVLVSPSGTIHESVVSTGYPTTNNKAEYETLIAGLQLALRMGANSVHVFCNSPLIVAISTMITKPRMSA